jgi:hypothetical protein
LKFNLVKSPHFVSLAASLPRVGVLAGVCCSDLRDENGLEKLETFSYNC